MLTLIAVMGVSASAKKEYRMQVTCNNGAGSAVFNRAEIDKVNFSKDEYSIDKLNVIKKDGSTTSFDRANVASITFPVIAIRPDGSYGEASVESTTEVSAGRTSCTWVQLWENGPKFAEFNVGSVISSYDELEDTTEDTTETVSTVTSTENVGGLYAYYQPSKNGRRTTWSSSTSSADVASTLWGANWKTPTSAQYKELLENYKNNIITITWCDGETTQYVEGCPISGWKISGVGDYEDNSVFFPFCGYFTAKTSGVVKYTSTSCVYWTSTSGYGLILDKGKTSATVRTNTNKYGNAVRAILAE